jgi:hypothetical protein
MANSQYFAGLFDQLSSQACIVDTTPPTFAGIASIVPNNNGALKATWIAASDSTPPIEYLIYIALGSVSAGTLFVNSNIVAVSPAGTLFINIFTLADQTTFIIKDQVYTMGIRSKDGVGNIDSNVVILTATALGSVDLSTSLQDSADSLENSAISLAASVKNLGGGFNLSTEIINTSMSLDAVEFSMIAEAEQVIP